VCFSACALQRARRAKFVAGTRQCARFSAPTAEALDGDAAAASGRLGASPSFTLANGNRSGGGGLGGAAALGADKLESLNNLPSLKASLVAAAAAKAARHGAHEQVFNRTRACAAREGPSGRPTGPTAPLGS
jgi:hypothetical protein